MQPALPAQMLLGRVIKHTRPAVDNHKTVGTIGHLVVRLASRHESALQQVQPTSAPLHLELQLTGQWQHPLCIVMPVQPSGLAVVPQVENGAHRGSVRV